MPDGHVAIVGMAGRFPSCDGPDGLWDLLQEGKDAHQEIPPTRFDINEFYDPSGESKNSTLTRYGCFLSHPGIFDNRFFNISPREAAQMDPLQRLFLTTTYEALEMAGYNPAASDIDPSRVSTYFGQSTDDWKTINEQQGIQAHYLPATNRSFAPGRVSHHFKWGGSYYSIDTGCSSSATAIHLACAALAAGECDMAVVGGGNICVIPEYFSGFSKGSFLSVTGGCKTFSHEADGYCRGEAVGTVILKRLSDSLAANDTVLGVVTATARNSNAGEGSITYPGESAQKRLLEELLRKGAVRPEEIGLVEMHGTGTQAGDKVETNSVREVLAGQDRDAPLYMSALKANIGHGEAAAGISSLIKALLMLRHDAIPTQPGPCDRFSNLATAGIRIGSAEAIPRSGIDGKRKLIVNSFDAAGGNTSVLLQEGPTRQRREQDPRTHHVVACSAKTAESLNANKGRLGRYLEQSPQLNLADLGYTTTARRMAHAHREAYVVESVDQLSAMLKMPSSPSPALTSSLAFVFTGQSSQYTAMGATLYSTSPRFQRILNEYETLCSEFSSASFLDVIRGATEISSATAPQVQIALVALEIALARFLQDLGLTPTVVLGHSLGEYSALCVAGVLSVRDTLYLVHERAALVESHCTAGSWGMMALSLPVDAVKHLIQNENMTSDIEICCLNGPSLTVVGGSSHKLHCLQGILNGKGVATKLLQVSYAFHSSQLDSILPGFEAVAEGINFMKPLLPVVSTLTGDVITSEGTFNSSYLVQQCRQPVNFVGASNTAHTKGMIDNHTLVFELGPHPVCTGLLALCLPGTNLTAVPILKRGHSDWEMISKCLATAYTHNKAVDWNAFHDDYIECLALVTDLPSYAFEESQYWTPYQRQKSSHDTQDNGFAGTSCLQKVESFSKSKMAATFVSKVHDPFLLKAIQGHLVDEVAICPASLFIDMACGAAQALGNGKAVEFTDLQMRAPLVVSASDSEQAICIAAQAGVEGEARSVEIKITSTSHGNSTQHAVCRVLLQAPESSPFMWSQVQRLIQLRVAALTAAPGSESCHKLSRALFYKLFDSIVEYSVPFRLLENITLDETARDAVAEIGVRNQAANQHGFFSLDPFIIDALVHLPGFLLNCDLNKPKGDLHIAKSIGQVSVLEGLRNGAEGRPLTCYATVTKQCDDGTTFCNTYLFNKDGELAAMVSGICFQRITRQTFGIIAGRPVSSPSHVVPPVSALGAKSDLAMEEEGQDVWSIFLGVVASITGVTIPQVKTAESFEALGVDSHMAISIIAETNRAAGVHLPAAFFANYPTISDAEQELRGDTKSVPSSPPSDGASTPLSSSSSLTSSPSTFTDEDLKVPDGKAILLQGKPNSPEAGNPLFLVTDSSGSITIYLHLPPLPNNRPIYVLESPFAHCPEKNTISIPAMAKALIAAMRAIQPSGPYLIGGFSFGSVNAYEVTYQLSLMGERTLGLLLMDMYAPPPALPSLGNSRFLMGGIPDGPMTKLTERLGNQGLLSLSDSERVHMAGTLHAASSYEALPISAGFEPIQTHVIWATKGINENAYAEEHDEAAGAGGRKAFMGLLPRGMTWEDMDSEKMALLLRSWFFAQREDFGSNGWEAFVGDRITIHKVDGDHISVLMPPDIDGLGVAIAQVVDSCTRRRA
ncbi:hypothetical protein BDV18DRAFT_159159 [Aspergillus unguis]